MITDSRIKFIQLPVNVGVNGARMAGVDRAIFPFVFFLDSDDEVLPNALQTLVEVAESLQGSLAVAVLPTSSYNDEGGKAGFGFTNDQVLGEYEIVCERALEKELSYLYRRDVFDFQRLPEDMRGCEFIFVYGLSRKFLFIVKNVIVRAINRQSDNLSSSSGTAQRFGEIGLGYLRIIDQHYGVLQTSPKSRMLYFIKAATRIKMAGLKLKDIVPKGTRIHISERILLYIVDLLPRKMMTDLDRKRIASINYKTFGKD
jgi:glycosyltransferase involved in cell wall biosynthesis